MKTFSRKVCMVLALSLIVLIFPIMGQATNGWEEPGNTDLNILNGGIMLSDGDDFYFNHSGIFVEHNQEVRALSGDDGKNLNLVDDYLYYTVFANVYRMSKDGGDKELVHTADSTIKQLYVIGDTLKYIAGGIFYEVSLEVDAQTATVASTVTDIKGLIPTQYGDILLTGSVQDYTIWVNGGAILANVQSCYTDSGYLAIQIDNNNYMVAIPNLFSGFDTSMLKTFDIHDTIEMDELFQPDGQKIDSEEVENDSLLCDYEMLLDEAGLERPARLFKSRMLLAAAVTPEVSQGQLNIVLRARQLHEISWTPLKDIPKWGGDEYFYAETTYTGIPYGQPVYNGGYVGVGTGFSISIDTFANAIMNSSSAIYSANSTYNKTAPLYSTDCSGFVSYAWGISRTTTYYIPTSASAQKVSDQSVYSLQVGDCLNHQINHVVLVSGVKYDDNGNINWIEILEQTPPSTKRTTYGEGGTYSLAYLQSKYLNSDYVAYRNTKRDDVTYTPNPFVPLDGETVATQKDTPPKSKTTNVSDGKSVVLTSDTGSPIYYTLDGSTPTTASTLYSEPITITNTTRIRAISVSGRYSAGSSILDYTAAVTRSVLPFTDVLYNDWFYEPINFAYSRSLFIGTTTTTFSPQNNMTRGMFLAVLGRIAGVPEELAGRSIGLVWGTQVNMRSGPSTAYSVVTNIADKYSIVEVISKNGDWYYVRYNNKYGYIRSDYLHVYNSNFTDMHIGHYYSIAGQWAYLSGITNGVATATSLRPEENITREDMCLILYNYSQIFGRSLPNNVDGATFVDDNTITSGAKTAVYALRRAGVIQGVGNNYFFPKSPAKRAEVAQIFMAFVKAVS